VIDYYPLTIKISISNQGNGVTQDVTPLSQRQLGHGWPQDSGRLSRKRHAGNIYFSCADLYLVLLIPRHNCTGFQAVFGHCLAQSREFPFPGLWLGH